MGEGGAGFKRERHDDAAKPTFDAEPGAAGGSAGAGAGGGGGGDGDVLVQSALAKTGRSLVPLCVVIALLNYIDRSK
jgi:hypothetical protein